MENKKLMRQKLLSKYLCPFTCDSNQPRKGCPFWHPAQPEEEESHWHRKHAECTFECPPNIKPLPPYCCASFLALKCSKREYSFQCGAHSSAEILTRCEDGFHMELGEVDDLQLFAQKMAKVLLEASEYLRSDFKSIENSDPGSCRNPMEVLNPLPSNYISAGQKRPRNVLVEDDEEDEPACAICLDQLRNHQIGHLDNCSHVFCAKCIHKWQNHGVNEGCPVCRKRIAKILVWPKLLQTQEEKKQLFDLISGEVPSDERVDRAMANGAKTIFKTSEGKTMSALQMNPESMKVFLKKPKPNWNCYVMTESTVVRIEMVPIVGSETTATRNNNEYNQSWQRSMIEAQRQQQMHISQLVMRLRQRDRARNAGSNNAATNNAATNNPATNNPATNNAATNNPATNNPATNNPATNNAITSNVSTNSTATNTIRTCNNVAVSTPDRSNIAQNNSLTNNNATTNVATNPTATNNAPPNINSQNTQRVPSVGSETTAPTNNENNVSVATNHRLQQDRNIIDNIRRTVERHEMVYGRRHHSATNNAEHARVCNNVAAMVNSARMHIRQTNRRNNGSIISNVAPSNASTNPTAFDLNPTNSNSTNNSAINNVATSLNSNTYNVSSVNSNTNNNAAIVNSNANNASTNNIPSQHREIINVEDSDDDEILLIGESSN